MTLRAQNNRADFEFCPGLNRCTKRESEIATIDQVPNLFIGRAGHWTQVTMNRFKTT
jgi:hypothetical protein